MVGGFGSLGGRVAFSLRGVRSRSAFGGASVVAGVGGVALLRVGRLSSACRLVGCVVVGVARRRRSVVVLRGGRAGTYGRKVVAEMFYRIITMTQDGQRETGEYNIENRDGMLE